MSTLFPEFGQSSEPISATKYFLRILLLALAVSVLRLKRFEAWDQVQMLWDANVGPLLLVGHPHFFRFMTAYPGFVLEELYPGIGFSLYISLFFAINLAVWRQLALVYLKRPPTLLALVLFVAFHFLMNGRGVIAWSSWLIAVWVCLQLRPGQRSGLYQWTLSLLACCLSAISTGVFVVIVVALTYFYIGYMKRLPWRRANVVRVALLAAPVLYEVFDYFLIAVNKNLDFYGGGPTGAVNMLNHGLGAIFFSSELILLAVLLTMGLLASICLALVLFGVRFSPMTILRIMPVLGGMFGFTVLTLAIPLALLALPPLLSHRRLSAPPVLQPRSDLRYLA